MKLFLLFGFGSRSIIAQGCAVCGKVTDVRKCWWMKVNTKPIRMHAMDGALFPRIIAYRYAVDGAEYTGKRFFGAYDRCPHEGETIRVYYNPAHPARSTLQI